MENNIDNVIADIDAKIEEVKSDPAYNEEEGRKQVDAMYDYMKDHPQSTDSLLNQTSDINKVIEDIDAKMEEVKSDPAYNEEEGRKQVDAMYDYMKDHPQSTDSLLNQTSDINKVIEDIDAKMEEVKSDPAYNEEEGRKQVDAMYDYMKDHPQSTK